MVVRRAQPAHRHAVRHHVSAGRPHRRLRGRAATNAASSRSFSAAPARVHARSPHARKRRLRSRRAPESASSGWSGADPPTLPLTAGAGRSRAASPGWALIPVTGFNEPGSPVTLDLPDDLAARSRAGRPRGSALGQAARRRLGRGADARPARAFPPPPPHTGPDPRPPCGGDLRPGGRRAHRDRAGPTAGRGRTGRAARAHRPGHPRAVAGRAAAGLTRRGGSRARRIRGRRPAGVPRRPRGRPRARHAGGRGVRRPGPGARPGRRRPGDYPDDIAASSRPTSRPPNVAGSCSSSPGCPAAASRRSRRR